VKAALYEGKPGVVSQRVKQAGEACSECWSWVEGTVWTEGVPEALENGAKGGVWFSLIDKVYRRTLPPLPRSLTERGLPRSRSAMVSCAVSDALAPEL